MIKNLDGVAALAGTSFERVHIAWKLAKRIVSADFQRGNYVLVFKLMCGLLKIRNTHLPEAVGDKVFLLAELFTITAVTPDTVTLLGMADGERPRVLPLINLILCERRQPNIHACKAAS